jgi:8-amino-7-oxononanoate synthase
MCTSISGSRLLTGNHPFYPELEDKIAKVHCAESCLIFNSGYIANLGLISALAELNPTFVYDLEIHASMIDGIRLSRSKSLPFRHNDLHSLERRLKRAPTPTFVLIESIYSVSGDAAPLDDITQLCSRYGAHLIIDEANSTEFSERKDVFARMYTFSKALGCFGACVVGSEKLKEFLINFSRPFIYTAALPLPNLYLIDAAYNKLEREGRIHRARLQALIAYFQKKSGRALASPIQPIWTENASDLSLKLQACGIDVRALHPPTAKKSCLRVVLHSFNTENQIDQLLEVIQ